MIRSRFLDQTHPEVIAQVCPNNEPDFEKLESLKTLFMPEISNRDAPQYGYVGSIRDVRIDGNEYTFTISFDHWVPPIPFDQIRDMATEFGTSGNFRLGTTHWAVKDNDLFEMLYRRNLRELPAGRAFEIRKLPIIPRQIALMMPFDVRFNAVHEAIVSLASELNGVCQRADDVWNDDVVIQDIVDLIIQSKVVICDVTEKNPNVFYEAGIAHALGKRVIIITQNKEDIPFDLRHLRYVSYFGNAEGISQLSNNLRRRVWDSFNE